MAWQTLALCGASLLLLARGNPTEAEVKGLDEIFGKMSMGQHGEGDRWSLGLLRGGTHLLLALIV